MFFEECDLTMLSFVSLVILIPDKSRVVIGLVSAEYQSLLYTCIYYNQPLPVSSIYPLTLPTRPAHLCISAVAQAKLATTSHLPWSDSDDLIIRCTS
jgi:hypothetical protein